MRAKVKRMTLQQVLQRHGIYTIRALRECTGLSSQQCWNLWWGMQGLGQRTIKLLHERCHIPLEELVAVQPGPRRRNRRRRPPEEGRPK
jgi:hypothetical protein